MGILGMLQLIGLIFSIIKGIPDLIAMLRTLRDLLRGADKQTVAEIGDKLKAAHAQYQVDKDQDKLIQAVKTSIDEVQGCVIARRCKAK